MKSRKLGVLTAAAIALGLAIAPVATFAAAPRAASQLGHSDGVTQVQSNTPKKAPVKKSTPKKASTTKKSVKKTSAKKA